ncbi:cysteine-rich motor neuron 1 protein [Drosophila teissieri]|uniref:cysteine-rich motor neuron 1 protein n=1 Tax=Drosophila teissieri TaxID=7243 RepID=UPI001CBA2098|nr:cysteine-rich motor neuron 1 protein [Drosophila teissieri]
MGGSARGVGRRGVVLEQDVRTRTSEGERKKGVDAKQQHNNAKLPLRMRSNGSYFGRLNVSALLIYLWCYLLLVMAASGGSNHVVNGLKCYCNPKECDVIRSPDCPGKGLMLWDPCKCCRICAKTLGESCGGPGGFSGQCEPPLQCVTKLPISSGLGVCMDLQHLTALTYSQHDNCSDSDSIVLEPGCEITNKRCQCWPTMRTCLSELTSDGGSPDDSRWHFKNLEDCQLNLQNLIKLEQEFDEDYKISPSKFTYKKLRRKRKSLRKRIIILKD